MSTGRMALFPILFETGGLGVLLYKLGFYAVTKMTTGITKIEDLLNQDRYKWGTVKGTHPEVALANSVRDDFKTIIRKQVL